MTKGIRYFSYLKLDSSVVTLCTKTDVKNSVFRPTDCDQYAPFTVPNRSNPTIWIRDLDLSEDVNQQTGDCQLPACVP